MAIYPLRLRSAAAVLVTLVALGAATALFGPDGARTVHEGAGSPGVATFVDPPLAPQVAGGGELLRRVPVAFVPNLGQWQHPARYVARMGAATVFLEEKGWTLALVERAGEAEKGKGAGPRRRFEERPGDVAARGVGVRMTFFGADEPELAAEDRLPGYHNYFLGNDPAWWRSEVPLYRAVRYCGVHSGVDVRAREKDGHFEYDLLLKPDAALEQIEIQVEGIERLRLDTDGALVMETGIGPLRLPVPLSWEEEPAGERNQILCRYVLRGHDRFGFAATNRRPGWALIVDPGLVWSTFLGESGVNFGDVTYALALDTDGAAMVAGYTDASNFPTTVGAFDASYHGNCDAFVTRFSPAGATLIYSTFLGGTGRDWVSALALDAQGAATVAGNTASPGFPTTPGGLDTSYNGGAYDAFVTRLSPTGASLVYSTFLGGVSDDRAYALSLDANGAAAAAGQTTSTDFPTTSGAFDRTYNGGGVFADAFIARISPMGASLVYSTFLGGTCGATARALAIDALGAATVAGSTFSRDFPTTPGAFDTSFNGGSFDAFVTRLSPTGGSLVYSTFLGGADRDWVSALALDAQGVATVAGSTYSTDFPTTSGAFDTSFNGPGGPLNTTDAFVTRLSPKGASLVYSTFLGGTSYDEANALALDANGATTVAGSTESFDFPATSGAFDPSYHGNCDAFVTRLSPAGASLVYSTFLGGTAGDGAIALGLDPQGATTVAGSTYSSDFPTTPGAFDATHNGYSDAFVTRLDMLPTGAARFGGSSPGCAGPLAISVTSMPRLGNAAFALTCGNGPPNSAGLVPLTGSGLTAPLPVLGFNLWVDPTWWCVLPTVTSNGLGAAELPLPVPQDLALVGERFYAQFLWVGPTTPPPCPPLGLSASNALEITIQP